MKSIMSLFIPKSLTSFLDENSTVRQAIELFDVHRYSVLPLIDQGGHFAGTVSEGDLLRFLKNQAKYNIKEAEKSKGKDIQRYREYRSLKVDSLFAEFFALSLEQNFIPVVDDKDVFIGIIKRREILKFLSEKTESSLFE